MVANPENRFSHKRPHIESVKLILAIDCHDFHLFASKACQVSHSTPKYSAPCATICFNYCGWEAINGVSIVMITRGNSCQAATSLLT